MLRRESILKMAITCMLPGAMVGAIVGVIAAMVTVRQADLPMLIASGALFGAFVGAIIGALIADHREPP